MIKNIRKYKHAYQVYNFFKKKYLNHNVPLYKQIGLNKKYYSSISGKDFTGLKEEKNIYDVGNSNELLEEDSDFYLLDKKLQESIINWSDKGYAIIPGFFDVAEVDKINLEIENLIDSGKLKSSYGGSKYMFANRFSKFIRTISNDKMKQVMEVLLKRKVELFQTINFKTGSQQATHSDSIHMSTFPNGNLIAGWLALEDVSIDDGPLHYYPGSHKLSYLINSDYDNASDRFKLGDKGYAAYEDKIKNILEESEFKKEVFLPKKGDLLIWHANLLHGGNKVNIEGSSRKSMVFHYLAKEVICYHEITERPTLKGEKYH